MLVCCFKSLLRQYNLHNYSHLRPKFLVALLKVVGILVPRSAGMAFVGPECYKPAPPLTMVKYQYNFAASIYLYAGQVNYTSVGGSSGWHGSYQYLDNDQLTLRFHYAANYAGAKTNKEKIIRCVLWYLRAQPAAGTDMTICIARYG